MNTHRERLLGGLAKGLQALRSAGCPAAYLDGSFVTAKPFPEDYDVCYEMAGVSMVLLDNVFKDFSNGCAAQKAKYFGEYHPAYVHAEGPPFCRVYLNFFQSDKDTGDVKGIVGIKLKKTHDQE